MHPMHAYYRYTTARTYQIHFTRKIKKRKGAKFTYILRLKTDKLNPAIIVIKPLNVVFQKFPVRNFNNMPYFRTGIFQPMFPPARDVNHISGIRAQKCSYIKRSLFGLIKLK